MKVRVNPILKKEIKLGARTFKFPLGISIYGLVFGFFALIALMMNTNWFTVAISNGTSYYSSISYSSIPGIFKYLGVAQCVMICIIIPILTAGSIAGERERQTLDIMLTAPVSSFSIVFGKLFASLTNVFMFIICTLPGLSLCFLYGGIQWKYLIIFVVNVMLLAFFVGAIGVFCSAVFKKTITSVIITLLYELIFFLLPLFTYVMMFSMKYQEALKGLTGSQTISNIDMGGSALVLLLDPFVTTYNSIMSSTESGSIVNLLSGNMIYAKNPDWVAALEPYWTLLGSVIMVLFGFMFLFFAARKISAPGRKRGRK